MKRREFLLALGGAAAPSSVFWPGAARAQKADRARRIAVFTALVEDDPILSAGIAAFQQGLQTLGWTEGRNVIIIYRHASPDAARLQSAAQELIARAPEVIVIFSNPAVTALRNVDRAIPGVFLSVGEPVGSGFVESLSRPGGNLTGFATFEPEMGGKWLGLLKEAAPAVTRAILLLQPDIAANVEFQRAAETASRALRIAVAGAGVRDAAGIESAVTALAREPNGGLVVLPNPVTSNHRELIARLAIAHRLPAIFPFRTYVESGGLMCYGPDLTDLWRRAAGYVDRILRGEKPASLPVQFPTKFELIVNRKTAKAIGLELPATLLGRADGVIE